MCAVSKTVDDKSDASSKENGIVLPTYPTGDSRDWEGFLKLFFPNMKMQFHEETKKVTLTGLEFKESSNSGT